MKRLLFVGASCFLIVFCIFTNSIVVKADEATWYEDLPTASTAEELFGTHRFSTEGRTTDIKIPTVTNSDTDRSTLATPSNANILEELIASDYAVSIPYNGRSEFVDVIAKIDEDTYVDVTSVVTWESEDYEIAYADDGRIIANNQGTTVITASLAGVDISIDVVVEDYIDLEAEIERLNSLYPDSPRATSTYAITNNERDNIIARGKEMLNVSWVPAKDLEGWRKQHIFKKGVQVTGIPYTQNSQKNASGFLASLSAGDFYDSVTLNNKVMPRYGNDCSGFLSFSWNISRNTTYDFTTGINTENNIEASGWKQIDGSWYYFLPQNHRMSTGWQQIDGVWYYLNPDNGAMHEGWLLYQNDWYYLKSGSGAMAANESIVIDGKTYHFNSSGVCTNP